jgi:hypothetical protein
MFPLGGSEAATTLVAVPGVSTRSGPLREYRRSRATLGVFVSLALAAFAAVPAGAQAPQPTTAFFGANIQPLIEHTFVAPARWGSFIATMSRAGLRTARMDAIWSWAEPNAPTAQGPGFVWNTPNASIDGLVRMLAVNHVRLSAVLDLAPVWAAGAGTELAPAYYGDYGAFAAAFAARYGVHGSFWRAHPRLPYLPVLDFEMWDEANSTSFWSGAPDVGAYATVIAQASAAIHAVDPTGTVLASIGWVNFQQYIAALYATGVGADIDGIAFQPYAPDAPGILELNEELRATLDSVGAASTPIFDAESGQPVVASGPGATYAYDGLVTDATRAATLSLAGDALARSDCGVDDDLVYGVTGSGTNIEPRNEGYMGIYSDTTDRPDRTGRALSASARAWRAHHGRGIVLCGAGSTPARDLLGLSVRLSRPGATCVAASVTYRGDPLEGAELTLRTRDGRVAPAATNALGQAQICLQNGPLIKQFTADAEIRNVARSPIYSCPVSLADCRRAR